MKNYCPELDNGSDSDYEQISSETSSGEEEEIVAPLKTYTRVKYDRTTKTDYGKLFEYVIKLIQFIFTTL